MSLIHLSTELRQELKLTPQLLQSMEVLQMNSQELLDYLNQVSEENPLVEQSDLSQLHSAYEALRQKVHWINGGLPEDGHGAMPERGVTDRETESLSAFLCDQLERLRLPKPLLALSRYLALVWLAFPISELVSLLLSAIFLRRTMRAVTARIGGQQA